MSTLVIKELYPYIIIYQNVFENPEKIYDILKRSGKTENEILNKWKDWYTFGQQIYDSQIQFDKTIPEFKISKDVEVISDADIEQKYFITELIKGFHLVNNDYLKRFNINLDFNSKTINNHPSLNPNWSTEFPEIVESYRWQGPSICKYYSGAGELENLVMQYHSDHIIEEYVSPGYKFLLTTTTYFNDDYEGGDIVFGVGDKKISYKPKAGDFVIFPSGHPDFLTENNDPFFHAVKKTKNGEKYFSRMYWTKFYNGDEEFFNRKNSLDEKEFKKAHKDYSFGIYVDIQKKYENLEEVNGNEFI